MPRLSGTVSKKEFSQGHNSTGSEREGGEGNGWLGEQGRMCWKGKRETRLGKSEKSVGKVLKPLKQNVQKCTVSKFFIQIRKCIKAQRKGWRYQRADRKGPVLFLCSHRET